MFRGPAHVKEGFACSALGELRRTTVYEGHAVAIGVAVPVDDASATRARMAQSSACLTNAAP